MEVGRDQVEDESRFIFFKKRAKDSERISS